MHLGVAVVCVCVFFGWSYGTIHGPTNTKNTEQCVLAFKKYFATVFFEISFQFSVNKRYLNTLIHIYSTTQMIYKFELFLFTQKKWLIKVKS